MGVGRGGVGKREQPWGRIEGELWCNREISEG